MKSILKKSLSMLLAMLFLLNCGISTALAYRVEGTATAGEMTFTDSNGKTVAVDATWEETFPYGTFAFQYSELTLDEGGTAQGIKVYRLGGTSGKATAYIVYAPAVVQHEGSEEPDYSYAISSDDIIIRVEDPLPITAYQEYGKDPDPEETDRKISAAYDGEEDSYTLTLDGEADSYQWYVRYEDVWTVVENAAEASFVVDASEYESGVYDFRLQFSVNGVAYCTDSASGASYEKPAGEGLSEVPENLELNPDPTYSELKLTESGEYDAWAFDLTFADGEYVKEIYFTALEDSLAECYEYATLTIADCEGASVYTSANTLMVGIEDNDEDIPAEIGFAVSEVTVDKASGTARLLVQRTGGMTKMLTVDYQTVDGTAAAGKDYAPVSDSIAFYGITDSFEIEIELINDGVISGDSGYFTVELSGLRGDDESSIVQDIITVNLYNSAVSDELNTASLLYDSEAVDISSSVNTTEAAANDLNGSVVTGEQAELGSPIEAVLIEEESGEESGSPGISTFSYPYPKEQNATYFVDLGGRNQSTDNHKKWTASPSIFTILGQDTLRVASKGAASQSYDVSNMDKLFSYTYLSFYWNASLASDWTLFWYGLEYTYPEFRLKLGGSEIASVDASSGNGGNWWSGYKITWYTSGSLSKSWGMNSGGNQTGTFTLATKRYDAHDSKNEAVAQITGGSMTRRSFSADNLRLTVHTANDSDTAPTGGVVLADSVYNTIKPKVTITDGGTNSIGGLFVGSTLKISVTNDATMRPATGYGSYVVYLTDSNGNIVKRAESSGNDFILQMMWDSMSEASLTQTYTIHVVMTRQQDIKVDLSPSKDSGNTDEASAVAAAYQLFQASNSSGVTVGYSAVSSVNNITTIAKKVIPDEKVCTFSQSSDGKVSFSGLPQNIHWINFNLSEEDILVINGKAYAGNEKIWLTQSDLSSATLTFYYYNKDYLESRSTMVATIDHVELYYDGNGNGQIDGSWNEETGRFEILDGSKDEYLGALDNIDYDESIFEPYVDEYGVVHQYFFKTVYTMNPRYFKLPADAAALDITGDETAQVLPAFITDATNSQTLTSMTDEQKSYRYITSGMDVIGGYTSDNKVMYGAEATAKTYVDIPLGGDTSPVEYIEAEYNTSGSLTTATPGGTHVSAQTGSVKYIDAGGTTVTKPDKGTVGWYAWSPSYNGNLRYAFSDPDMVYIENSLAGSNLAVTGGFTAGESGVTVSDNGKKDINAYLGSFAGNDTFALVVQEQEVTTDGITSGYDIDPESITRGEVGSFPNSDYLANMNISNNQDEEGVSDGGKNDYSEFSSDFGVSLAAFEFGIGDYFTISTDEYEVSLSVGIPLGGYDYDSTKPGDSGWSNPKKKNADNLEDMGKALSAVKNFVNAAKSGKSAKESLSSFNDDGGMSFKAGSFEFSISMSLGFVFKYNALDNKYKFAEAGISVEASVEFTYRYRFTPVPIVYVYITLGAKIEIGTGLGVESEAVEESTLYLNLTGGNYVDTKKNESYTFNTSYKAFNITFEGKLYMELLDSGGQPASGFTPGYISSDGSGPIEVIMLEQSGMELNGTYTVKLTALENAKIYRVARITDIYRDVYWSGVKLEVEAFLEIGAGIGVELAKFEIYAKVTVGAAFLFGAYDTTTHTYNPASVESFKFQMGLGFRAVFLFFSYEMDLIEYHVKYENGTWSHGYSAFGGALGSDSQISGRALLIGEDVTVTLPGGNATTQTIYSNGTGGGMSLFSVQSDTYFDLSSYGGSSAGFKLMEGVSTGYDYRVVTVGSANYLVYTISRNEVSQEEDYTMLVMSRIAVTESAYGLVNPADSTASTKYIVIDDDDTGDLDFEAWAEGSTIYVSWVSYKERDTTLAPDAYIVNGVTMTEYNYTTFDAPTEPTAPIAPAANDYYTTITKAVYDSLVTALQSYYTQIDADTYGCAAVGSVYADYTAAKAAYDTAVSQYNSDKGTYDIAKAKYDAAMISYNYWSDYYASLSSDPTARQAAAAKNTEVKLAGFDTESGTAFSPAMKVSADTVSDGGSGTITLDGYTFLPATDGSAVLYGQTWDFYSGSELQTALNAYKTYLLSQSNYTESGALNRIGEYRMAYQEAFYNTYGTRSSLNLAYEDSGGDYAVSCMPLSGNQVLTNMEFTEIDGTYYVAYTTQQTVIGVTEMYTIIRLYLRTVTIDSGGVTWSGPYLLRTLMNYDVNDGASGADGVYSGSALSEAYDDPYFSNLQFLNAKLGGTLGSASNAETFLLFEMNGSTYVVNQSNLKSITSSQNGVINTFFTDTGSGATGISEMTIGADGDGNLGAVFVGNVKNTTNNALYISYYDPDTGTWGDGTMVAMMHMDVYEKAIAEGWDEETAEAAYYDENSGGGMSQFVFSNVQIAMGTASQNTGGYSLSGSGENQIATETSGSEADGTPVATYQAGGATLLIISQGTLTELEERYITGSTDTMVVPKGSGNVGVYAVSYGFGEQDIGNAGLSFAFYDFSANSNLYVDLSFMNTGDTAIRYDSAGEPIEVSLYVHTNSSDQLLSTWNITENIKAGQSVSLSGYCAALNTNLSEDDYFYITVSEDTDKFANAWSGRIDNVFVVEEKTELSVSDLTAKVNGVDSNGNVVLDVSMVVNNTGDMQAENVYVQFAYESSVDENGSANYSVINITGNTLKTSEQEKIIRLFSINDAVEQGVYYLNYNGETYIDSGYCRTVSGTITIPSSYFSGSITNSLNMKVEVYSDSSDIGTYNAGVIECEHSDEYNASNNYSVVQVEHTSFIAAAHNITLPLGSVLRLPVTVTSTTGSSPEIEVYEVNEEDASGNLGILYYSQSSFSKNKAVGALVIMPSSIGSGVIHITDTATNTTYPVVYTVTEAGDGVNVFDDNKMFTFYDADSASYEDSDDYKDWTFQNTGTSKWGSGIFETNPYRYDLAIGTKGAYFTFETLANEIEFYFDGTIEVTVTAADGQYVTLYDTAGKLYGSSAQLTASGGSSIGTTGLTSDPTYAAVYFSNEDNATYTVTVKVAGDKAYFDTIAQYYPSGIVPTPSDDADAPSIYWGRNYPDTASMVSGETVSVTVSALDSGGLTNVTLDGSAVDCDKADDNLWEYTWTPVQNGKYTFKATDTTGATTTRTIEVYWFADSAASYTTSFAPEQFSVTLHKKTSDGYEVLRDSTTITAEEVSGGATLVMIIDSDAAYKDYLTYTVYFCDGESNSFRDITPAGGYTAGSELDITGNGNGYYRVVASYKNAGDNADVQNGTWSAQFAMVDAIDPDLPGITLTQVDTYSALSGGMLNWSAKVNSKKNTIAKAAINGIAVYNGSGSTAMSGRQSIEYGGEYAATVTDTNNISVTSTSLNAVVPVYAGAGVLAVTNSWDQADSSGVITIDFNKVTGGRYANSSVSGVAFSEYYGSYQYAYLAADDYKTLSEFTDDEAGGQTAAQKYQAWLDSLSWSGTSYVNNADAAASISGLTSGEYVVLFRDTAVSGTTAVGASVGTSILTITDGAVKKASTPVNADGVLTVTAENSITGVYQFAILPLAEDEGGSVPVGSGVNSMTNPDMSAVGGGLTFRPIDISKWVGADWQLASGSALNIGELNGLASGYYMAAVRVMYEVTAEDMAALTELADAVDAAEEELARLESRRDADISSAVSNLNDLYSAWQNAEEHAASDAENAYMQAIGNDSAILDARGAWKSAQAAATEYYEQNQINDSALTEAANSARETYQAAVEEYFSNYYNNEYADLIAAAQTAVITAKGKYDDELSALKAAETTYDSNSADEWDGVYYAVFYVGYENQLSAEVLATSSSRSTPNGSITISEVSGSEYGYQYAILTLDSDTEYTLEELKVMDINWEFTDSLDEVETIISGLDSSYYQVLVRPIYGAAYGDIESYYLLKGAMEEALATYNGIEAAIEKIASAFDKWWDLEMSEDAHKDDIEAALNAYKRAVGNDATVLEACSGYASAFKAYQEALAGGNGSDIAAKEANYQAAKVAYDIAVDDYVAAEAGVSLAVAKAAYEEALAPYLAARTGLTDAIEEAYKATPGYWENMYSEMVYVPYIQNIVTVTFVTNCSIKIEKQTVRLGSTATEPEVPEREGYDFEGWYTDKALTKAFDFSTKLNNDITLYAKWSLHEGSGQEEPVEEEHKCAAFVDIEGHWAQDAICYVTELGLMNGTSGTTFEPNSTLTRAMVVTVLYRLDGEPAVSGSSRFSDVADGQWYTDAIIWAAANGVVEGYGDDTFGPNDPITREQLVTIFYRYTKFSGYDTSASADLSGYKDLGEVSSWALTAMRWSVKNGIVEGTSSTALSPKNTATRAEVATILQRFCEKIVE